MEGNLDSNLYEAGRKWNEVKAATPEKLEAPMRVILMQKLLLIVLVQCHDGLAGEDREDQENGMADGGRQEPEWNGLEPKTKSATM